MPVSAVAGEINVRKIAVDKAGTVWIATPSGVLSRTKTSSSWSHVLGKEDEGPAYVVFADASGNTWIGNWNERPGISYLFFKRRTLCCRTEWHLVV